MCPTAPAPGSVDPRSLSRAPRGRISRIGAGSPRGIDALRAGAFPPPAASLAFHDRRTHVRADRSGLDPLRPARHRPGPVLVGGPHPADTGPDSTPPTPRRRRPVDRDSPYPDLTRRPPGKRRPITRATPSAPRDSVTWATSSRTLERSLGMPSKSVVSAAVMPRSPANCRRAWLCPRPRRRSRRVARRWSGGRSSACACRPVRTVPQAGLTGTPVAYSMARPTPGIAARSRRTVPASVRGSTGRSPTTVRVPMS